METQTESQATEAVVTQIPDEPVRVRLRLSADAQAEYLQATGREVTDPVTVTVPPDVLDSETRRAIASWRISDGMRLPDLGRPYDYQSWYAPLLPRTADDWRSLVAAWQAKQAEIVAEKEAWDREKKEREAKDAREREVYRTERDLLRAPILKRLAAAGDDDTALLTVVRGLSRDEERILMDNPNYRATEGTFGTHPDYRPYAERVVDEIQRERETREAEAEAERLVWIAEHGSERLKRLVAEGIEHEAVYRDERLAAERPGWRYDEEVPGDSDDPRNPPLEALKLLDEARASVPEGAPEIRLVYWTVDSETDECYEVIRDAARGYTCMSSFLGRDIVYRVDDDGTPPVVID